MKKIFLILITFWIFTINNSIYADNVSQFMKDIDPSCKIIENSQYDFDEYLTSFWFVSRNKQTYALVKNYAKDSTQQLFIWNNKVWKSYGIITNLAFSSDMKHSIFLWLANDSSWKLEIVLDWKVIDSYYAQSNNNYTTTRVDSFYMSDDGKTYSYKVTKDNRTQEIYECYTLENSKKINNCKNVKKNEELGYFSNSVRIIPEIREKLTFWGYYFAPSELLLFKKSFDTTTKKIKDTFIWKLYFAQLFNNKTSLLFKTDYEKGQITVLCNNITKLNSIQKEETLLIKQLQSQKFSNTEAKYNFLKNLNEKILKMVHNWSITKMSSKNQNIIFKIHEWVLNELWGLRSTLIKNFDIKTVTDFCMWLESKSNIQPRDEINYIRYWTTTYNSCNYLLENGYTKLNIYENTFDEIYTTYFWSWVYKKWFFGNSRYEFITWKIIEY